LSFRVHTGEAPACTSTLRFNARAVRRASRVRPQVSGRLRQTEAVSFGTAAAGTNVGRISGTQRTSLRTDDGASAPHSRLRTKWKEIAAAHEYTRAAAARGTGPGDHDEERGDVDGVADPAVGPTATTRHGVSQGPGAPLPTVAKTHRHQRYRPAPAAMTATAGHATVCGLFPLS
jgi:hypothetical protein